MKIARAFPRAFPKMFVSNHRDILLADVADKCAASTRQLVATAFFDKRQPTFGAFANQCGAHGFLHRVTLLDTALLLCFLTRLGYMRLLLAKSTADRFAIRVQTSELFIFFNWRTYRLEFTERAFLETVNTGFRNFIHLL